MTIVIVARAAVMLTAVASVPDGFAGMIAAQAFAHAFTGRTCGMATAKTTAVAATTAAAMTTSTTVPTSTAMATAPTTALGVSRGDRRQLTRQHACTRQHQGANSSDHQVFLSYQHDASRRLKFSGM